MTAELSRPVFHRVLALGAAATIGAAAPLPAQEAGGGFPAANPADAQPLLAQVRRISEALDVLGVPLVRQQSDALAAATALAADGAVVQGVMATLDPLCIAEVTINPESRVKAKPGSSPRELVESGWTVFLVKVINEAGVTAPLRVTSPNAQSLHGSPAGEVRSRWLDLATFDNQPMTPTLSGLGLEYRIVQLYSRDAGKREAKLVFDVGQGTQDLGFRSETDLLFDARPARTVALEVRDENGEPTTAAFEVRDRLGRVYPAQSKRLAPDFAFHPQVYRHHGESLKLPDGAYTFTVSRGPESLPETRSVVVSEDSSPVTFQIKRWIDPAARGWWSGDHHIHAAGCAHYTNPTEGVHAPDMMRQCLGEDLKVGANLTWGPCFDYQKQFFTGTEDEVSTYPYLLRYDVEVSGFGSHRSGHLCLLRLKEQIYPGGDSKDHWPTLCLNTLKWAQKQGAVCGPAHSGWGLQVPGDELPNFNIPPYDGIGANEYIVDVTHEVEGPDGAPVPAVDFLSMCDTPYVWELNIWYHTLNCGFRTRVSGETDFPCIYGERVGLGRSYVQLDDRLTYDDWCLGVEQGRNYVSDGRSHLLDFRVESTKMGQGDSALAIDRARTVKVAVDAAAFLPEIAEPNLSGRPYEEKPYWHIERARMGASRDVMVEIVVNGNPIASAQLTADGTTRPLEFEVPVDRSSWVAARILGSSHTNPVWVVVGDQPVHPSKRSAQWCLDSVEQCWSQKEPLIAAEEMADAKSAYDHARDTYRRILASALED